MIAIRMETDFETIPGRLVKLPNNLEKKSLVIAKEWARAVVKSAKLRAPRSTGTLAGDINWKLIKNKKGVVSTKNIKIGAFGKSSFYAPIVNNGWKPHWIPIDYIWQHQQNPGARGQRVDNPSGWVLSNSFNTNTKYLTNALDATKKNINGITARALKKLR